MEKESASNHQAFRTSSATGINRKREPFRLFFLIAATDAMLGAAVWLPLAFITETISGASAGLWHRNALLFGTVPAILAGFLLTALPRWTKQPAVSQLSMRLLAAIWLAARGISFLSTTVGLLLAAVFVLSLTVVAARPVITSNDRRNFKVVLLLSCFCGSVVLSAGAWHTELALRMAIASIIALVAIIAGRVIPALTAAYAQSIGAQLLVRPLMRVEIVAAFTAVSALAAWVVAPQAQLTGVACAIASCSQAMRVAQWRGWLGRAPWSIIALHIGYCWIVVGFMLLAIHIFAPESVGRGAGIHAWTIGAIGTMGLAIMASMIRKHSRRPFSDSLPATAAFVSMTLSSLSRLLAGTSIADIELWITMSAGLWIVSFGLFLLAFGGYLLRRE